MAKQTAPKLEMPAGKPIILTHSQKTDLRELIDVAASEIGDSGFALTKYAQSRMKKKLEEIKALLW